MPANNLDVHLNAVETAVNETIADINRKLISLSEFVDTLIKELRQ